MKAKSGKVSVSSKAKPAAAKKPAAKKVASKKTAAKPAAKKPAPAKKPTAKKVVAKKPAAKPAPKKAPAKKPAAKKVATPKKAVAKKPAVKATPKKAAAPKAAPAKKPAAKPMPKAAAPLPPAVKAPAPAAPVADKARRPSSRLAQLTVPSMAQAVASTAAKASYLQTMPAPVIVPTIPAIPKKDPKLANNWKTKPAEALSDDELMAMPDSEYMNDKQLAAFRLRLLRLKQDILNNAGETTEHLREDTVVVPDPADRATIEEEHALELRTRDRERKLLKKIEQSLARIDAGDYGYCDETGEPIGVGRLLARPTATLSLEAQQRRELKQKMFGD